MDEPELPQELHDALNGALKRELRAFSSIGDRQLSPEAAYTYKFDLSAVAFDPVLRLLCRALGATEAARSDKTAWLFYFSANGQDCCLRRTTSGIKLDLHAPLASDDDPWVRAKQIEGQLVGAARRVYRRVVSPNAQGLVRMSDPILLSQPRYRGMVDFYKGELTNPPPLANPVATNPPHDEKLDLHTHLSALIRAKQALDQQAYRATALVAGYFSWVQHLLVRLTAFSPTALNGDFSLTALLEAPWASQFDSAYPSPHGTAATRLKNELKALANAFRNPLLHGGNPMADGVVIEWSPGEWTFAVDPADPTDAYMLWQPALNQSQVDDLLARIARIDEGFKAHPFYEWVASGIPAHYGPEHVARALHAINTGAVPQYTAAADEALDRATNWG